MKQARQRWAAYVDRAADLDLLDGDLLPYTDFNPLNILLCRIGCGSSTGLDHPRRGIHRQGLPSGSGDGFRSQRRLQNSHEQS